MEDIETFIIIAGVIVTLMFIFACISMSMINKFYERKYCSGCNQEIAKLDAKSNLGK